MLSAQVDVLWVGQQSDEVAWHENDGSQSFAKRVIDAGNCEYAEAVFPADINGDPPCR